MSVVGYNSVVLPYAIATQFNQDAVYDDQGGADWILTKFDISVQAIIHPNHLNQMIQDAGLIASPNMQNPANIMNVVRLRLMQPRKDFHYFVNGVDLIPKKPALYLGTVDAKNGPQPQSCVITQLTEASFLITYRIIANYWERISTDGNLTDVTTSLSSNPVLSNRWSETVEIDNCNYSKHTREGKFTIHSDNSASAIADMARRMSVATGITDGFLRESSTYTVSPDGLSVTYKLVDKEQFKMPPKGAYEASGEYEETISFNFSMYPLFS